MAEIPGTPKDTTPLQESRYIDALCSEFEEAWRAGRPPKIELLVEDVAQRHRPAALRELIALEIELREAAGESLEPREYDLRFPDHLDCVKAAFALAGQPTDHRSIGGTQSIRHAPSSTNAGTVVGRYKLLEKIGEGGFGEVWAAEQSAPVKRRVALKIIKLGMDTKEVIARFELERQALALMDHPNIAKVLDAGMTESGRPYFVMELVQGIAFNVFCDQKKLSTPERLELFVLVCQAIQHAHQKGVIHRDIKPSNILVTEHSRTFVPKVIDFGVAKAINQQLTERTIYTQQQQMIGTPLYMSPEQADLTALDVDTRTDIYSLGVVLYELLAGETPFEKQRFSTAAYDEIRRIIREEEPPKPSTRIGSLDDTSVVCEQRKTDARRLRSVLRGELDWIVMKALEKDRARRYDTTEALATDIQRYLGDEPVSAGPPSVTYRARKFIRRNRAIALGGLLAVATLLLATIISTAGFISALRAKAEADRLSSDLQQQNAAESRARALAVMKSKAAAAAEHKARQTAETRRKELYTAQIDLAQQAWRDGELERAQDLLASQRPAQNQDDLRGFEWRYLWRLCQDESRATLGTVAASNWFESDLMSFSPDGTKVAIGAGKTVTVWELADGHELATYETKSDRITALVFSPTGPLLLAISDADGTIGLWDLTTNMPPSTFAKAAFVEGLAVSSDGKKLAATRSDGRVELWDVETRTQAWSTPGHGEAGDPALCVAFSPDGKLVASGGGDTKVKLWSTATGEQVGAPLEGHTAYVLSLDFSTDGRLLATGGFDARILIWDIATRLAGPPLLGHKGRVTSVDLSADGKTLVSGGDDSTVRVWSVETSRQISLLRGHTTEIKSVAFSPDGQSLVSVSSKTAKLWDAPPHRNNDALTEHTGWVEAVVVSPDGKTVAASDYHTFAVKLWDIPSRTSIDLVGHTGVPRDLAFSPDGKFLASGGDDQTVRLWDVSNHQPVAVHPCGFRIGSVTFSADGKILGAAGDGLTFWSVASGREVELIKGDTHSIGRAAFSPRGSLLATSYRDGRMSIWNTDQGKELTSYRDHQVILTRSLKFSSDGALVAVGKQDGSITLFDVNRRKRVGSLQGQSQAVTSVAFTPDSRTLASASHDSTVKLWNIAAGRPALTVHHLGPATGVSFSGDGRLMATCGADATVRLWPAASLAEADAMPQSSATVDPQDAAQ